MPEFWDKMHIAWKKRNVQCETWVHPKSQKLHLTQRTEQIENLFETMEALSYRWHSLIRTTEMKQTKPRTNWWQCTDVLHCVCWTNYVRKTHLFIIANGWKALRQLRSSQCMTHGQLKHQKIWNISHFAFQFHEMHEIINVQAGMLQFHCNAIGHLWFVSIDELCFFFFAVSRKKQMYVSHILVSCPIPS